MGIPADQLPPHIRKLLPPEPPPAPAVIAKFDSMEKYDKEKELQDAAEKWFRMNHFAVLYRARMDMPTTAQKGISDFLVLNQRGQFIAAEAKLPGRKPSLEQTGYLRIVELHGGNAFIFHSLEELIAELKARNL